MRTALLNWISAATFDAILEKVLLSIETRMVRKSVSPKKAKVTIRIGPISQWNSTDFWIPVPSRPNQTNSIHLEMVMAGWLPLPTHTKLSRNPAKHHIASKVRTAKSAIMARRDTKSIFSESRLKAKRGISTGAAADRISSAVVPDRSPPVTKL